jgi:hypothetical protein
MLGSGVAGSRAACSRKNRYVQGGTIEIGIGLPATIPGTRGSLVLDWAGRADSGPFSSLGIIDRLVYPNYETLVTLAAAAAVTERVRLMSTVLIAPLRGAGVPAKQAASVDPAREAIIAELRQLAERDGPPREKARREAREGARTRTLRERPVARREGVGRRAAVPPRPRSCLGARA